MGSPPIFQNWRPPRSGPPKKTPSLVRTWKRQPKVPGWMRKSLESPGSSGATSAGQLEEWRWYRQKIPTLSISPSFQSAQLSFSLFHVHSFIWEQIFCDWNKFETSRLSPCFAQSWEVASSSPIAKLTTSLCGFMTPGPSAETSTSDCLGPVQPSYPGMTGCWPLSWR